jgi:hypothetical protein
MTHAQQHAQVHPFVRQLELDLQLETFDVDPGPTSYMVWKRQQARGNSTSI